MKERFIRWLLEALDDERVRATIAEIVKESQPELPIHRPINGSAKRNTAPGAIS